MRNNKKKLFDVFEKFIIENKHKAKQGLFDYNDDYETFKMIYAIAELFPVNKEYKRSLPKIECYIKELWLLYYYFKQRIDGKNLKYKQIVIKYS